MEKRSETIMTAVFLVLFGSLSAASCAFAQDSKTIRDQVTTKVPSVLGLSVEGAKGTLQAAGLGVKFSMGKEPPKAGQALRSYAQEPAAGRTVSPGSEVTVTIYARAGNARTGRVPDLSGLTTIEAKASVLAIGLVPKFQVGAEPAPAGKGLTVYAQNPKPGQSLAAGTEVRITVYPRASDAAAGIENKANESDDRELRALQERELSLMRNAPANLTPAQLDKEFAEVRWAISRRFGINDPAGAISYGWTSLRLDPGHADRWEQLGDLANFSGETTSAADSAAAYKQALSFEPGRHLVRLKLACAQLMMGEPGPAAAQLEIYLSATDTEAKPREISLYATACATSGQEARGAAFCEAQARARANASGSNVYRLTWAILENARGGREKAIQILTQVEKNEGAASPLGSYAGRLRQSYTSRKGAGK